MYIISPIYGGETGVNMYPVPPPSAWESLEWRGVRPFVLCTASSGCKLGSSRGVSLSCRRLVLGAGIGFGAGLKSGIRRGGGLS